MGCAAVIVASGSSRRMGFDKLAAPLAGIPVLRRAVDAFMAAPRINRVIVVCPEPRFRDLLGGDFPKPLGRVDGGATRQDSVLAGLAALGGEDETVAIHDGARPLVTPEMIDRCIQEAVRHGAATLARPVTETIKKSDSHGFTLSSIDREQLWFMETPQIFRTELLRQAYIRISASGQTVTDEVSVMEFAGHATRLISAPTPNIKITVPADIPLAEALLR